jgi:hypothetical protein
VPDFPRSPPKRARAPEIETIGLELGFAVGIRVGVPTDVAMAELEMRVDLHVRDWIVLLGLRYAPVAAISSIAADADSYGEGALVLGVGRELRWGRSSLDLVASPTLAFVSMETDSPVEKSGSLAQLRLAGAARFGYAIGRDWRFTITLDSELAPGSLVKARYADPALPPLPAWTLGLRLGASARLL